MYKILTMKVLIADSSTQITKRLRNMIKTENKLAIVYDAANYESALQLFNENKPAVVLLNMDFQGKESMRLLESIKETGCQTTIVILSIYISKTIMDQYKLLGATIFLDKFLEFEKIPEIISGIEEKRNQCNYGKAIQNIQAGKANGIPSG